MQVGRTEFGEWEDMVLLFSAPAYLTEVAFNIGAVLPGAIGDLTVTAILPDGITSIVLTPVALQTPTKLLKVTIPKADFSAGLWHVIVDWGAATANPLTPTSLVAYWGVPTPQTVQQMCPTVFDPSSGKLTVYDKLPSSGGVALYHQLCYSDVGLTVLATSRASILGYGPQHVGA